MFVALFCGLLNSWPSGEKPVTRDEAQAEIARVVRQLGQSDLLIDADAGIFDQHLIAHAVEGHARVVDRVAAKRRESRRASAFCPRLRTLLP